MLSIIERTKTLEDACRETGKDIVTLFDGCPDDYKKAERAIETFAEALREGKPASECFYYPWFWRSAGGGFSLYDYARGHGCSNVGARLRVDTREKAIHLGECMQTFYETYLKG